MGPELRLMRPGSTLATATKARQAESGPELRLKIAEARRNGWVCKNFPLLGASVYSARDEFDE